MTHRTPRFCRYTILGTTAPTNEQQPSSIKLCMFVQASHKYAIRRASLFAEDTDMYSVFPSKKSSQTCCQACPITEKRQAKEAHTHTEKCPDERNQDL